MSVESQFAALVATIKLETAASIRDELAHEIMIGPFDDAGLAAPGTEKGPGFALYIGEWRLGWWATRPEACEVADRLTHAITSHPLRSAGLHKGNGNEGSKGR